MSLHQRSYQIDYFCGWRYLLSPKFRNQARQKWGSTLLLQSLFLIGGFTSILLTATASMLLIMAIWHIIN